MITNRGGGITLIYIFQGRGVTVRLIDLANPHMQAALQHFTHVFGPAQIVPDRRRTARVWEAT